MEKRMKIFEAIGVRSFFVFFVVAVAIAVLLKK
jgi:hypothetical protein